MNLVPPETGSIMIPAYSRRQVMDWSLVLASQDIPSTIVQPTESEWALAVEPTDHERALEAIRLYRLENRRWTWRQPLPWADTLFHWGSLGWCFLLILVHWLTVNVLPGFREAAQFDSARAASGQWWRAFTAILLHADLSHLLANTTTGFLLFGLAMARYGAAEGLFAAYLAGAAGNLAGLLLSAHAYFGVGASGMVMGALGLIAVPRLRKGFTPRWRPKQFLQGALASVLLFVLLGVSPGSDVIAHLGGFVAGVMLGFGINLISPRAPSRRTSTIVGWAFAVLFTVTTCLALRHG